MIQYCRYCSNCIAQDDTYGICESTNQVVKKTTVRQGCKLFAFCEVDAFYFNRSDNPDDARYQPRKPKKKQCDGQIKLEV